MNDFFDFRLKNMVIWTLGMLIFFLFAQGVSALSEANVRKKTVRSANVIAVRGTSKISVTPDLAAFSITIREEAADAATAQQKMVNKSNGAIALLKEKGVSGKDVKTENYNTYPKYSFAQICVQGVCPPSRQTITGYEASQTISVKVRDTKKAAEILTGVSKLQVSEVSGLSFMVEEPEKAKIEARNEAIENAKEEAKRTAKSLGVKLGDIVGFNEDFGGGYFPMATMMRAKGGAEMDAMPQLEPGEQKISSSVTITYEIR